MTILGIILLALCFAEEVVELDPVTANGDTFTCSQYSTMNLCQAQDGAKAYCIWNATAGSGKCIDDPQLRVLAAGDDGTGSSCENQIDGVSGSVLDLTAFLTSDCAAAKGSGKICARTSKTANDFSYCVYAWLRDGVCPESICVRDTSNAASGFGKNQCLPTSFTGCAKLDTETQCGLVPKCYWASNSLKCVTDPCWAYGQITVAAVTCETLLIPATPGGTPATDTCKAFKPLIGGTPLENHCVHKKQSNPNICYFGTPNSDTTTSNDYLNTYPTYRSGRNPVCTTPIAGTACEGNGNCTTIINAKGALAGQYCTDGTHGNSAANILHIPSLLFLLAMSLSLFAL